MRGSGWRWAVLGCAAAPRSSPRSALRWIPRRLLFQRGCAGCPTPLPACLLQYKGRMGMMRPGKFKRGFGKMRPK